MNAFEIFLIGAFCWSTLGAMGWLLTVSVEHKADLDLTDGIAWFVSILLAPLWFFISISFAKDAVDTWIKKSFKRSSA